MNTAIALNPVLREIERDGMTQLADGRRIAVHSAVGPESGRLLRRAIAAAAPRLGCEVGLAFGVSALHILDAMTPLGGRLIGMDPAQHDATWQGAGLHNIERAGLAARYEFHEHTSQQVLPQLAASGTRIQFAFVDGWHTFDHTLVDFFYLDLMMDVGGILVLDDVGYPALQRLAHFILTNRAYRLFDAVRLPRRATWRQAIRRGLQAACAPLLGKLVPSTGDRRLHAATQSVQMLALEKVGNDDRRFDHFAPF